MFGNQWACSSPDRDGRDAETCMTCALKFRDLVLQLRAMSDYGTRITLARDAAIVGH